MPSKLHELLYAIDAHRHAVERLLANLPADVVIGLILPVPIEQVKKTQETLLNLRKRMTEDAREASNWEEVAVYYADCQAATASTFGNTKSLSRYETGRQASVCTALADSLEHGCLINKRPSDREQVIKRLKDAAESCRKKLNKE